MFKLHTKFATIVKTVISFFEVDFSFDKNFLVKNIEECRTLLKQLVEKHLTDKSLQRIDYVLNFFSGTQFLEDVFKKDSPYRTTMQVIVDDMNKALEAGKI
ncbi:Tumor necrosis factor alpha-induced protein 8-like protein [Armadillidium nasatum]|uniref:Tumor necrosis factor alpha-induced protein 8-like protein n=1 Tax=Armadillidium nasatum TaxID=96803 RepID=A0A5N5T831_9CRUS|nr:Tumor necrosis factor alpha-induced protein 8-like protein [Armadillidium nasatum]